MDTYQFVILGSPWDLYLHAYADVLDKPGITYIPKLNIPSFLKLIYKIHLHPKINSFINLPYKEWWYKYLFASIPSGKPICFLLFSDWYCNNPNFINYLRKHFPNCKITVIFQDLIKTKIMKYTNQQVDIEKLKKEVDLVLTFDFEDARKYDIQYHFIPYSIPKNLSSNIDLKYDVYFLGQAKNRLKEILGTYHYLRSKGLNLNFILAGVPISDRQELEGIRYVEPNEISYTDNIRYIEQSKCLLEIMQKGGTGYTSRTLEAITYGKKLLTNNQEIKRAPFYNPSLINIIDEKNAFSDEFFANISRKEIVDYHYAEELSPIKLLQFIELHLK